MLTLSFILIQVSRRTSRNVRPSKRPYDNLYLEDEIEDVEDDLDHEVPRYINERVRSRANDEDDIEDRFYANDADEAFDEMDFSDPPPYTGHYQRRSRLVPRYLPPRNIEEDDYEDLPEEAPPEPPVANRFRRPVVARRKKRHSETRKLQRPVGSPARRHMDYKKSSASSDEDVLASVDGNQYGRNERLKPVRFEEPEADALK